MRPTLILMSLLALAACGADGEPVQPTANTHVTLSNDGVSVGTAVGLRRGPFNLTLGAGL